MVALRYVVVAASLIAGWFGESSAGAQSRRLPQIGFLTSDFEPSEFGLALQKDLRDLNYVEGKSVHIEVRGAAGQLELLPGLARDLVRNQPDAIVVTDIATALAAKRATSEIPIVMAGVGNAFEARVIEGLARPGGNVTGVSLPIRQLAAKQLELLKDIRGGITKVAILWNPEYPGAKTSFDALEEAAQSLHLTLQSIHVRQWGDLEAAFSAMAQHGAQALLVIADPLTVSNFGFIARRAAQAKLPSISGARDFVSHGGLLSYESVSTDLTRRSALFVSKILTGAKPGDLPVEEPARFEFIINAKTANLMGLSIPNFVAVRADEVIE